jgi:hypothetical protein
LGDVGAALLWTEAWVKFDPRSINAGIERASLLSFFPFTYEEGQAIYLQLRHRFPTNLKIAGSQARVLLALDQGKKAFEIFSDLFRRNVFDSYDFVNTAAESIYDRNSQWKIKTSAATARIVPRREQNYWQFMHSFQHSTNTFSLSTESAQALILTAVEFRDPSGHWQSCDTDLGLAGQYYFKDTRQIANFECLSKTALSGMSQIRLDYWPAVPTIFQEMLTNKKIIAEIIQDANASDLEMLTQLGVGISD